MNSPPPPGLNPSTDFRTFEHEHSSSFLLPPLRVFHFLPFCRTPSGSHDNSDTTTLYCNTFSAEVARKGEPSQLGVLDEQVITAGRPDVQDLYRQVGEGFIPASLECIGQPGETEMAEMAD